MGRLSAVQIEKWRKAGKPITGKSDGNGLTFTLSNGGTASWVLRYSFGGKQRELTLGNYPDISLKRAREMASEKRVEVDRGADVATKKRIAKIDSTRVNSFRELTEDYMERAAPSLSPRYRAEIKRFLSKDILPRIGGIPVKEVRPADIVVMTERIAERSTTVAKAAFTMVSAMFDHGVGKHLATENPCRLLRISSIIGRGQAPRQRIGMNDEQLRAFLAALPGLGKENELALKVILVTAVRKGELARARWEHIDLDAGLWRIPPENQKVRQRRREVVEDFVIPLPPQVVGWFLELMPLAGGSPMVMPARHRTSAKIVNHSTFNRALSKLPDGVARITPHDLRSTARTNFNALGVNLVVAERCLNHSISAIVGEMVTIYDKSDYLEERRQALILWAAKLAALEKGEEFNVVPLRKSA